jgi:hypothetical protein
MYEMTRKQVDGFLAANGLTIGLFGVLMTPADEEVGMVFTKAGAGNVQYVLVHHAQQVIDGVLVRTWWPNYRPAYVMAFGDDVETGPTLPPDEVICDYCNASIQTRPVAMVGEDALCPACFAETGYPFPGSVQPFDPNAESD